MEDWRRSGRPSKCASEVNIAKVKEIVSEKPHLSLREMDAELSVSHWSIRTILNNHLGMKHVAAWLIPKDDNAPLQKAIIINEFLTKISTNITKQPSYSPDMAPADFFLFPKLKLLLRGTRFHSVEDIKKNSRRELNSILEKAFKKYFDDWIIRWHKCIVS